MEDKQEPIAIVGMSCRFPGDADCNQGFWELLSEGKSAWSKIPNSRFNIDAYYHPSAKREGAITTDSGFYLKGDPSKWDAGFFSMAAAEAAGTDPQQRILLELAYEAFENAGMSLSMVAGSATSCYIGAFNSDYGVTSTAQIWDTNPYSVTGIGKSMLSNRLSWFFDLRGASMTLDTACSSSLVGLHLAMQSLRNGESKMALVGGANLISEPQLYRSLSALSFLSPDGRCHSFDAAATGYGRGEGLGILVLKPLKDALRDNDTIRAVIRHSGLNQDGKTPAITMPSGEAQAELIRSTYLEAGLDPKSTQYFEAHGTGTAIGDPIEVAAIGASLCTGRTADKPLYVGSVKTNVGHLESCAGVAGVMKAVLAMENDLIPSVVGLETINPRLHLENWGIKLNTEAIPWPSSGLRRASVNSFGYGGANAHIILDDAKHYLELRCLRGHHSTKSNPRSGDDLTAGSTIPNGTPSDENEPSNCSQLLKTPQLVVLSSPEQGGVARLTQTYAEYLGTKMTKSGNSNGIPKDQSSQEDTYIKDLAYTLSERRTAFDWRSFAIARTLGQLQTASNSAFLQPRKAARAPACAFVFTGQGAQYYNMGRELQANTVFRESLRSADSYLSSLGCCWSVLEELNKPEETSRIGEPELSQPLCTIVQVAIVDLLKHWGITPQAVVGHSSGEIAAAYASGALSQKDTWKISYFRGVHSGRLPSKYPELKGTMMAVALSEEAALKYVDKVTHGRVVVACINSPSSVTLSGDTTAINEVETALKNNDVWCRMLKVTTAYHSHHMKFVAKEYLDSIKDIKPSKTLGPIRTFSSVTEKPISALDLGPQYWVDNMLSPVRFAGAVATLLAPVDARNRQDQASSIQSIVEIGPHSVLKGPLNQILSAAMKGHEDSVTYMSVLLRGKDAYETAVGTAGQLWALGHDVNLSSVNSSEIFEKPRKTLTDLPPYPWNHERSHWHESRYNKFGRMLPKPRTDLLGYPSYNFEPLGMEHTWINYLKPVEIPWVMEHVIQGLVVFPAAGMIAMAVEACQQICDPSKSVEGFEFRDLNFTRALMFSSPDQAIEVSMKLRPHFLGTRDSTFTWHKFHLTSISKDGVTAEHCNGLVRIKYVEKSSEIENGMETNIDAMNHKKTYEELLQNCTEEVSIDQLYADLWTDGMQFGPLFKLLSEMKAGFNSGVATLTIPDTASVMLCKFEHPLLIHPAVLDGVFQFGYCNIHCGRKDANMIVISSVEHLYVSADVPNAPGTVLRGYEKAELLGPRDILTNIVVSDPDFTKPLVTCKNVRSTYLTDSNAKRQTSKSQLATRLVWKEDVAIPSPTLAKSLAAASLCLEKEMCSTLNLLEQAAQIYLKRAADHLSARERRETTQQLSLDFLNREIAHQMASSLGDGEILTTAAASSPLGKILQAFRDNISDIIDGAIDPYGILRGQGFENHDTFNETLFLKDLINSKLAAWFDMLGDMNPDLQILNIGSGSVSTSASILDTLSGKKNAGPRYSKYMFSQTDNTSRLAAINELSERYPNVDVLAASIDDGLDKQKKSDSKYDVVIIEDVMRGVTKIESAIQSAKRLLKPGGKLVVLELTNLTFRAGLLFSLTGQWTMSPESNANTSREHGEAHGRWTKLLTDNGMSPPDALVPDFSHDELHQMSLIISTYPKSSAHSKQTIVLLESTLRSISKATILSCNMWKLLTKQGFEIIKATIGSMPDPENKIFISMIDIDTPFLDSMSERKFVNFKTLTTKSAGVLWLTRAGMKDGPCLPNHFSASGLFRVIRAENPHLRLFNLDLSTSIALESIETCNLIMKVFQRSFTDNQGPVVEHEYAEAGGALFAPRLIQEEAMNSSLTAKTEVPTPQMEKLFQPGRPLKMIIGEVGLLDTFRFVDREEYEKPLEPEEVDVQILATGLNFVDIMASLGYIPSPALGAEFSGIITHVGSKVPSDKFHIGQVVAGIGEHCYASNFRLNWRAIEPVPKGVEPETAATCIIAYATAYFALYENGRLKKGQTILIHYGAGGLGQAAVQLAQHIGAVVYCTVGSLEKKKLMMERYGIPEHRIFNSRDTTFAKGLMRETNGRGVDVILNSTFGEMLRVTWNCLADFGVMVEVGKRDILSNNMLEMAPFIRGCTFSAVNLAMYPNDCELDRLEVYREVVKKVLKLFEDGHITSPQPLAVMSVTQAEEAFRSLQSGKLAGKIVLRMDPDAVVPVMPRKEPPLQLDPNVTYLLAGGLGGIGRSLSDLMVKHGARNIAFISRSGGVPAEAKSYLEKLRNQGVNAIAYACDIADRELLEVTLQRVAIKMPKIKGFIHAAMLLKDTVFENMTYNDWVAATRPKIQGSFNFHELLPKNLDFFIMLSSVSGVIGHPGQANYAAGNTFQNGLAHFRHRQGLKATSIDLGAVSDIGYFKENMDKFAMLKRTGTTKMSIREHEIHHIVLAAMSGFITKDCEMPPQLTTGLLGGEDLRSLMPTCPWAHDSKFLLLRKADGSSGATATEADPMLEAIANAKSLFEVAGVVRDTLVARLAKGLHIESVDVNVERPLHAYGVDSLVAVEIRNWVMKELKSEISILDILSAMPIHDLAMKISASSKLVSEQLRVEAGDGSKEQA